MENGECFERGVEAPDGIHDRIEKNEYYDTNIVAPDGIHDRIEKNEYYDTNMVALALIGASVVATIIGVALLLII